MRRSLKAILVVFVVVGLFIAFGVNYVYTAPSTTPTDTVGCVKQADGNYFFNGHICDRVNYTLFKRGMTANSIFGLVFSSDPYFYHLLEGGWKFLNSSNGGSYFAFETHNLLTNNGATTVSNQLHQSANGVGGTGGFTIFIVNGVGLSSSPTAPAATDTNNAGPCAQNGALAEITFLGLTQTTATYTAGTASGGSISPQLKKTWTAYGTLNNVQVGCAWAEDSTLAAPFGTGTLYAENTFTAVNLASGDQLTLTWTFTYSG